MNQRHVAVLLFSKQVQSSTLPRFPNFHAVGRGTPDVWPVAATPDIHLRYARIASWRRAAARWSERRGSNPRPERWQRPVLPLNYVRKNWVGEIPTLSPYHESDTFSYYFLCLRCEATKDPVMGVFGRQATPVIPKHRIANADVKMAPAIEANLVILTRSFPNGIAVFSAIDVKRADTFARHLCLHSEILEPLGGIEPP